MAARRRRRYDETDALNLDSLIDVVTNTNGMLILLAVLTALFAATKLYDNKFPEVRPTTKQGVYFEAQNGEIVRLDRSNYSVQDEPVLGPGGIVVEYTYSLKPEHEGFGTAAIRNRNSPFWTMMSSLDPEKQFPFLFVRPDSFQVYRELRSELAKRKFEIGWWPVNANLKITLVSGGGRTPKPL